MDTQRTTAEKIALYQRYFHGSQHAYGTYDPFNSKVHIVKKAVTEEVIFKHLKGIQPFGVFLLVHDRTYAIAADFDDGTFEHAHTFIKRAAHYGLPAYMERSKSKGYHAWIFFEKDGVLAAKARIVVAQILEEIEVPSTEIFPKQDAIDSNRTFGNFINAPLFGSLVLRDRTVFVDTANSFNPFPNQWDFLDSIQRVHESQLDEIIEINSHVEGSTFPPSTLAIPNKAFGLLPCAKQLLYKGATEYQRVLCFRLAIHLKQLGFTDEYTVSVLKEWALKNRPNNGKQTITEHEIETQTYDVYKNNYACYGCDTQEMKHFCSPQCPIIKKNHTK
ncbi:MAG: hypothetical protein GY865_08760 [candidate division Zixibacteria bacterium]|nr:hypothetical protein [candidate division Zixibacteria bacterium]